MTPHRAFQQLRGTTYDLLSTVLDDTVAALQRRLWLDGVEQSCSGKSMTVSLSVREIFTRESSTADCGESISGRHFNIFE